MNHPLKVSIIQMEIQWGSSTFNLGLLTEKIKKIKGNPDLIILPETFATGFTTDVNKFSEDMNGKILTHVRKLSATYNAAIAGSVIISESGQFYNRGFLITPDGTEYFYDKRHLFSIAGENKYFTRGEERPIMVYKGWNICLQICYDLRFPIWSRNTNNACDLLIYIANWPAARQKAWTSLLPARAIENQVYVCGVNCSCFDDKKTLYVGHSAIYSPLGEILSDCGVRKNCVRTCVLDKDSLETLRIQYPFSKDADQFTLT